MFQIHDHPLTGHRMHTCKCTALCAIGGERDEEPQVVGICTWLLWHNSIPLLELWHHSILTRTLLGLCHISFKKSGCMQDEFNFAFAHWGNDSSIFAHAYWLNYTRWFWDGHMHSTMAPRLHKHLSQGLKITILQKSLNMARMYIRKAAGDIHVSSGRQNHDIHHMFGIINYLYLNMGTESLCLPFCWIDWDFVPLHFRSFLALPIVRVSLFYNFLNAHSCKVHILVHIFSLGFGMVNLFTPLSHLYMQPKRPSYSKIKITLECERDQK